MAERRGLFAIVSLAAILHGVAISRSSLPAQDGLKFIRVARQFQSAPWADTIRATDQHPLYPALVGAVEPLVALFAGGDHGPDIWRISAQVVAAGASLLLLLPLYQITRNLFDRRIATLAVAIYALLPLPAGWGRETLADSVGLCGLMFSLWLGARAIRDRRWQEGAGAGLAAGLGYLARPEIILAPLALCLAFGILQLGAIRSRAKTIEREPSDRRLGGFFSTRFGKLGVPSLNPAIVVLALGALVPVGSYALVKGEVSEKLALRHATSQIERSAPVRKAPQWLPAGLDDRRWDFSPKEESEHSKIVGWSGAATRIFAQWWRELAGIFAVMFAWGLVRQRFIRSLCPGRDQKDTGTVERTVLLTFQIIYAIALARHCALLGYLSDRHTLALVLTSTPWAAAGTFVCLRGLAVKFGWSPVLSRKLRLGFAAIVVLTIIHFQLKTTHASRSGHLEAGKWLAANAYQGEATLDTRGWASFVADRSPFDSYDYWHVRQALTDRRLGYIVVETDELDARSRRAETLQAMLAFAAEPIRDFPESTRDDAGRVRIYRFRHPENWKGMLR